MNRKKILAANWKMNLNKEQILFFLDGLSHFNPPTNEQEMHIYAPTVYLETTQFNKGAFAVIGAQNVHQADAGAFTGETSVLQLKDLQIQHTLIGHSERRQYFHESDDLIFTKVKHALQSGITVLLCIGETLEQRSNGQTEQTLQNQLNQIINSSELITYWGNKLNIAYEPVWAIGTGQSATFDQAQDTHQYIRSLLKNNLGIQTANNTSILYGGSVNVTNIDSYLKCTDIDGCLVGGASLKLESWKSLWEAFQKAYTA